MTDGSFYVKKIHHARITKDGKVRISSVPLIYCTANIQKVEFLVEWFDYADPRDYTTGITFFALLDITIV